MAPTRVATADTPPTVAMWDAANFLCLYGNNVVRLNLLAVAALLAAGAVAASPALDRTESSLPSDLASKHRIARRSVLAEGVNAGHFRATDERMAALSVLGMCNWVAWWYNPAKGGSPERIVSVMSESAVAMLARPSHRLPKATGPRGAVEQLREDLDYLDRLIPDE
jgi:hypothetical protein